MGLAQFCQEIPAFQLSTVLQSSQKMWLKTYGPLLTYHQVSNIILLYFTERFVLVLMYLPSIQEVLRGY